VKKKLVVGVAAGLVTIAGFSSVAAAASPAKPNYTENYTKTGSGDWAPNGSTLSWANGAVTATGGSPFSYFGGTTQPGSATRMNWPTNGYIAQLDVYLDPTSMASGEGFDLDVASSKSDGTYGRDYIFHVGKTEAGEVLVSGSNNSTDSYMDETALVGGVKIETAGWYTLQHVFYDKNGTLAVDLNVINAAGAKTWVTTLNTTSDTIATSGGPRYEWLTFIDGTIKFDNQRLFLKDTGNNK
jgi:hypothetical protein